MSTMNFVDNYYRHKMVFFKKSSFSFVREFLFLGLHELQLDRVPSTWEKSTKHQIRFVLSSASDEYKTIASNFDQALKGTSKEIIRIERIQNERWYIQYLAHLKDFKRRLNRNTEKRLYHGCPEEAASSILEDGFNRSYAGKNGKSY